MGEGSLYAPDLAALAIMQSAGDAFEASFIIRAYRTTLPRFSYSLPVDTMNMRVIRRISSAFKDIPGGQYLGPTSDYTFRLLDFEMLEEDAAAIKKSINESNAKSRARCNAGIAVRSDRSSPQGKPYHRRIIPAGRGRKLL